MKTLRALSLGVLMLALAVGVAQHQGLIQPAHLQQLRAFQGRLLAQPAVAATVDRLRTSLPWLLYLLPSGGNDAASCTCGVSKV